MFHLSDPVMMLQANIDSEFINKGHLGNISDGGIRVDKDYILIRGNFSISSSINNV